MIQEMADKITWLRHASFRIDTEKVIYIDPFKLSGGPEADIILITHDHYDHCSPADIAKIRKEGTVIITEKSSAEKLAGDIRKIKVGESIDVDGIKIKAVPAYNLNKKFHPANNQWIGFLITIDDVTIYHAGDSDYIPEMKNIDADIALLPVSGTYVMTADEAVQAALNINPEIAIPMHYDTLVGDIKDAEQFKNELAGKVKVTILNQTERDE